MFASTSILELKEKIQELEAIPISQQKLILDDVELDDADDHWPLFYHNFGGVSSDAIKLVVTPVVLFKLKIAVDETPEEDELYVEVAPNFSVLQLKQCIFEKLRNTEETKLLRPKMQKLSLFQVEEGEDRVLDNDFKTWQEKFKNTSTDISYKMSTYAEVESRSSMNSDRDLENG
jgi:mRNA deadenylase 3'-5' endonuclease subunit Ccr4